MLSAGLVIWMGCDVSHAIYRSPGHLAGAKFLAFGRCTTVRFHGKAELD
jgi:hypothetical protein